MNQPFASSIGMVRRASFEALDRLGTFCAMVALLLAVMVVAATAPMLRIGAARADICMVWRSTGSEGALPSSAFRAPL